ncbi:MAG: formate--tetrahydrofolate ligase, partial [Clostridia bacterium]|nr:formate--tetrahydrofolate ligase [Clostridia bacterium]
IDIKCRQAGLYPDCVVLVATVRALKHHGGVDKAHLNEENVDAMLAGCGNLWRHLENIQNVWRIPAVVAVNRFTSDTDAEAAALMQAIEARGVPCAVCEGWGKGGEGARELARLVCAEAKKSNTVPSFTYPDEMPLKGKIEAVAKHVYGASSVTFSAQAEKQLSALEQDGFGRFPVCIAKTQYSFSDDAARRNAPEGFTLTIRQARLSAGAGFCVAFAGEIIAMPGLPRHPAALDIDVDENGRIKGLF